MPSLLFKIEHFTWPSLTVNIFLRVFKKMVTLLWSKLINVGLRTVSSLWGALISPAMAIPVCAVGGQLTLRVSTVLYWINIHSYLVCLDVICWQGFFILDSIGKIPHSVSKHLLISAEPRFCESSFMGNKSYAFDNNENINRAAGTFFHLGQRYNFLAIDYSRKLYK